MYCIDNIDFPKPAVWAETRTAVVNGTHTWQQGFVTISDDILATKYGLDPR